MNGALSHIRVLDLTRILAGPWCTQNLADLGAEVIKVERPGHGDDTRRWGPPWLDDNEQRGTPDSSYFASANRNKKSIEIDIATTRGQDIVRKLAATSDVFVENYKVGDLARYGLDYPNLKEINPRLVYCSITGYGQTGPQANSPGYDFVFQGQGGLMSITGEEDGLPGGGPQKAGIAVADIMSGMYACVGILAALNTRTQTGVGQYIDISLLDCIVAFGSNQALSYLVSGEIPGRFGNAHPNLVPYQVFCTSSGSMVIAAANDEQWKRFCNAIDQPGLANDPRYATGTSRVLNREILVPELERIIAMQSTDTWMGKLKAHSVPCGPINDYREVFRDPQVRHRGMQVKIPDGNGAFVPSVASPIRLSHTPVQYRYPPPRLGEHTEAVLRDLLG